MITTPQVPRAYVLTFEGTHRSTNETSAAFLISDVSFAAPAVALAKKPKSRKVANLRNANNLERQSSQSNPPKPNSTVGARYRAGTIVALCGTPGRLSDGAFDTPRTGSIMGFPLSHIRIRVWDKSTAR